MMTSSRAFLEAMGFAHVENDEPHEDHWLLEGMPGGLALLVEEISGRWSVHHDPRGVDAPGEWTLLAGGLSSYGMIETVSAQLEYAGIRVDDAMEDHMAHETAGIRGRGVDPRIDAADLP